MGTLDDIIHKKPLDFKLMVSNCTHVLPRITYISINNQPLCVGEHLTGNAMQKLKIRLKYVFLNFIGVAIVNTVNLQLLIKQKLTKSSDSDFPNMQYIT